MSGKVYAARFSQIPEALLDAPVSDRAYRVYGMLHRYAGRDGQAFPGRQTVADRLKCSLDSLDRAIKELAEEGFLTVEPIYRSDGGRTASNYRLATDPQPHPRGGGEPHPRGGGEPHPRGGVAAPTRHISESQLSESQLEEEKPSAPNGANQAPDEDKNHPDYGFQRFWTRYPKRDGKRGSKAKALVVWRHMTYTHKAEAWRQLGIYLRVVEAGRPAMDAERWLRKGRDEGWDPAEGWDASGSRTTANGSRPPFETEDPTAATVERWKPLQDAAEQEFIKASAAVVEQMRSATRKGPE